METKFQATVLTIFPELFPGPLGHSLAGKALSKDVWRMNIVDIRKYGITKHKNVDDEPYGGADGMVMRPDVLGLAIDAAIAESKTNIIYYMSPRGKLLNQNVVNAIIEQKNIIILCGRFAGIDERVIQEYNIIELSLGDFILSGGEIACYSLLDACVRLLKDVVGNSLSVSEESFGNLGSKTAILEYPLYTRPEVWNNRVVPDVLKSGNHQVISKWRQNQSEKITLERRPDLLKN